MRIIERILLTLWLLATLCGKVIGFAVHSQLGEKRSSFSKCKLSVQDLDWTRIQIDAAAAFIGGTFGVLGTLVVYEQGRYKARMRVACAYCEGSGSLPCGACAATDPDCMVCGGTGRIKCVNCEATGLAIPAQLERKPDAQMDDELETKLDQIGIAALAADILKQEANADDMTEFKLLLQRRAEFVSRKAKRNDSGAVDNAHHHNNIEEEEASTR